MSSEANLAKSKAFISQFMEVFQIKQCFSDMLPLLNKFET